MTTFYVDPDRKVSISYEDLITELNSRNQRHPIVYTDDPSEIMLEILLAILGGEELTLLDSEFSEETLASLGYDSDQIHTTEPVPNFQIDKPENLLAQIENTDSELTLTVYTSGTTGIPDPVDQTLNDLTRSVRQSEDFRDHVWAFAYNPTHLAGLQVFFQAILNLNPLIYIFESSSDQIGHMILDHGITHISATPTFYRLRLQQLDDTYRSVRRLTSGGERFETSLQESLREIFPDAEFRNIYAITEAGTLLESDGEVFNIPKKYSEKLKISEGNELIIHKSLLAKSVEQSLEGDWYHTGDIVESVDTGEFRFVGRKSDFVNVGGYRVNPHNIEQQISTVEGVAAAVVYSRESSVTGNILVAGIQPAADVDPDTAKQQVKNEIKKLERWKQPRIVNVVKDINRSRSGKRIRGDSE